MKFRITILLILSCTFLLGQKGKYKYNDGPYIKYMDQSKEVLWISEGKLYRDTVPDGVEYIFDHDSLTTLSIHDLDFEENTEVEFDNVSRFTAISDIHGQFDLFRDLLIAQKVVDENDNWIYGDGHLVIVGDVMDRGPKVIESLWYIYHLEKKAQEKGGKVHLLLGNHELMVINSNLGYINHKYRYTSGITQQIYSAFFGPETFFGKWLSSKKITISINDVLFVHGGFSERIKNLGKPLSELNGIFQEKLFFRNENAIETDSFLNMLYFDNGPLWYRGYAFPSEFDKERAKSILAAFDKEHIVVGHTSMPEIKGLYGNRIILIDSSIKFGDTGEVLVYQDSTLYKGKLNGELQELISEEDKTDKKSIFTTIYEDPDPVIRIATPIRTVFKNGEEKYEESMLYYYHKKFPYSFNIGLRTSGNMRRQICSFPPLKVNFKKKELKAFGYTNSDKFKILMPCRNTDGYLEHLKTEH
ncbi:MAG: metallophosphoesterase, partial [Bacteroidia bacterium]|nr:metallophosphoesterase [Bacteroidia bacterium]